MLRAITFADGANYLSIIAVRHFIIYLQSNLWDNCERKIRDVKNEKKTEVTEMDFLTVLTIILYIPLAVLFKLVDKYK